MAAEDKDWDMVLDRNHDGRAAKTTATSTPPPLPVDFLTFHGLSEENATRVVEQSGCQSFDDLKLFSEDMVQELIREAGLKLIPAEKLRRALAAARESASTPATTNNDSGASSSLDRATSEPKAAKLQEVVCICIDRSFSMGSPLDEVTLKVIPGAVNERSRMEAVKVMFYAYRDRVQQLSGRHQVGLIQFDEKVDILLGPPTDDLDQFEAIVDEMEKRGSTAIFSAIIRACEQLAAVADEDSDTDLRVLVLTDGENNIGASAEDALDAAHRIGAVVDAFIVGNRPDPNLRRVVAATGGEAFQIMSLGKGFELLEAEGVVSLKARRSGAARPPLSEKPKPKLGEVEAKGLATAPVRKATPTLRVVDLEGGGVAALQGVSQASDHTINPAVKKRLMKELKDLCGQGPHLRSGEGVHLFPSEGDITEWRAVVEGPVGSPFEGGTFVLSVSVPGTYPFKPPKVRFETPVYHCNVNDAGGICLDILNSQWSPRITISEVIGSIRTMLAEPDTDNALRQWIAELTIAHHTSGGKDTRYVQEARRRTAADASKSVEEWRREWSEV